MRQRAAVFGAIGLLLHAGCGADAAVDVAMGVVPDDEATAPPNDVVGACQSPSGIDRFVQLREEAGDEVWIALMVTRDDVDETPPIRFEEGALVSIRGDMTNDWGRGPTLLVRDENGPIVVAESRLPPAAGTDRGGLAVTVGGGVVQAVTPCGVVAGLDLDVTADDRATIGNGGTKDVALNGRALSVTNIGAHRCGPMSSCDDWPTGDLVTWLAVRADD